MDLLEFERLLENTLEEEDASETQIERGAIIRNALTYTKEGRKNSLTLPKKAFDLKTTVTYGRVLSPVASGKTRCVNLGCFGDDRDFTILPHDGSFVCTCCGSVQSTPVIQELEPFYWNYNSAHRTDLAALLSRDPLNSYQPKFHWNEDEKLRRLTAPSIPKYNRDVIFWQLDRMGFSRTGRINNPKLVVQEACRLIDTENGIHLYGRKWGEHWMTITCQYTRGLQQPPIQNDEDRLEFSTKFDWFYKGWPMCSHLLPGSKKDRVRWQLPQFRWIFRQFLITFTPHEFERWSEWLPLLSKNKEIELDLFWKRMCFINGWTYRHPEPFIKMIKDKIKKKRKRRTLPTRLICPSR